MLGSFLFGLIALRDYCGLLPFREKPPQNFPYPNPEQLTQDDHPEKAKDDQGKAEANPKYRIKSQFPSEDHQKAAKKKENKKESPAYFLKVTRQRPSQHSHHESPSVSYYHSSGDKESPLPGGVTSHCRMTP
jgi:hypothetical protein